MSRKRKEDEEPFIQLKESSSNDHINAMAAENEINSEETRKLHCHDIRPVFSNNKAWKRLMIASTLCFIFAIGEVVGKRNTHLLM